MVEYRDLYDKNKQMTGKSYIKGESIPDEYYNIIVNIIIKNSSDEFLIQKRVPKKGGQWALTGGHPKAGETSLDGIKSEVREELGLNVDNENIILFTTLIIQNHFIDLYYLKKDINIGDLCFQKDEVDDVKWATKDEILSLIERDDFFEGYKFLEYLKVNSK